MGKCQEASRARVASLGPAFALLGLFGLVEHTDAASPGLPIENPSRRESSLAGSVIEVGGRPVPDCDVEARAHDPGALPGDPPPRIFHARTDARGLFQIVDLPAGMYTLRAEAKGRSSPIEIHRLTPGRQQRLGPLEVRPPQPLELRFDPPRDPLGHPWLLTVRGSLDDLNLPARETPVESGRWTHPGLLPDMYEITVGDSRGNIWRTLSTAMRGPTTLDVDLGSMPIAGQVRLGGQPLAARLVFASGGERMTLETDARGRYRGFLPDWDWRGSLSSWFVTLRAHRVARRLLVQLSWPPAGEEASYDVDLPGTSLRGVVVDENGTPVSGGAWLVLPGVDTWGRFGLQPEPPLTLPLEPPGPDAGPGEFLVRGLGPDRMCLTAEGEHSVSDSVLCTFSAKGESRAQPLVLRPVVRTHLRMLDSSGPLGWARALVWPIGETVGASREHAPDYDERLDLVLPGDTKEIALAVVAGGGLFLERRAVRDRERATLRLPEASARLALDRDQGRLVGRLFLLHDNQLIDVEAVRRLGVARGLDADGSLVVAVPPGHYALCALTTAEWQSIMLGALRPVGCAEGLVAAGAELQLSLSGKR